MAFHRVGQSRVKMKAKRVCNAWNNFMEELDHVVMESNHTMCEVAIPNHELSAIAAFLLECGIRVSEIEKRKCKFEIV